MTQHMKLNPSPFAKIRNGTKTIELRLYDEKRRKLRAGDKIIFTDTENAAEKLEVRVKELLVFDSFDTLYKTLPLTECGYTVENIGSARPEDMNAYFSTEEQRKWGVVGIKIELL